jgi:hypothetical protein
LRKPQANPAPNPSSKDQISFDIPQMNLSCSSSWWKTSCVVFDALFHPNSFLLTVALCPGKLKLGILNPPQRFLMVRAQ